MCFCKIKSKGLIPPQRPLVYFYGKDHLMDILLEEGSEASQSLNAACFEVLILSLVNKFVWNTLS